MAKLSDLVLRASEITGVPVAKVREISRRLREAGLISTGHHGRYGGADMTARDAASLLTALLIVATSGASAASLNDIALLTKSHLQNLVARGDDDRRSWSSKLALPQLSNLKFSHTFGDAFSALIASISNGELEQSIKKWNTRRPRGTTSRFEIRVQINKPAPHQEAGIGFRTATFDQSILYLRRGDIVLYPPRNWSDIGDLGYDLRVSGTLYEPTLKAIGVLLRGSGTGVKADPGGAL
jgi:hypothetical protein